MTTFQDCSVGFAAESAYGTAVTVTRFPEFVDESFAYNKNVVQGAGLRVGSRLARSARRVITTADGGGDITVEANAKGLGLLWQLLMGSSTSTLVSGATYQQVHTLGDTQSPATWQIGLPRVDGTVDAYTYTGCMCTSFELDVPNGGITTIKSTWDAKDLATGTAYAAPSYTAGNLFHFAGAKIYTGTLTAPTTTALASATTQLLSVRSFKVNVDRAEKTDRYNLVGTGRKDKPTLGPPVVTGEIEVEYAGEAATFRDAIINDTAMSLLLTIEAGALGTGVETLQVALPAVKFDGDLVSSNAGDLIMQPLKFSVLDGLVAAQPIWVVGRTADTAL